VGVGEKPVSTPTAGRGPCSLTLRGLPGLPEGFAEGFAAVCALPEGFAKGLRLSYGFPRPPLWYAVPLCALKAGQQA